MASNQTELTALKKLLSQTDLILSTMELPQNSTARCRELLRSAPALTDDLISQAKLPAAAILGRKGGSVTAKGGSAYFRKLAARRKTHGGGRPTKKNSQLTVEIRERISKTARSHPLQIECPLHTLRIAVMAEGVILLKCPKQDLNYRKNHTDCSHGSAPSLTKLPSAHKTPRGIAR